MVLIESLKASEQAAINRDITMDSGHRIFYVAPYKYSLNEENVKPRGNLMTVVQKKLNNLNGLSDDWDKWESVGDLCQILDNAIIIENDSKMFEKKRILEIGFCTGLPSVFAFAHGANSVALHSHDQKTLDKYVRSTLRRNNIPRSRSKLTFGDYESCKQTLSGQKYDVILAPELICTDESEYEAIHEILDAALAPNGIILFTTRLYYSECSGSLPTFLDFVKHKGCFDAHVRWTSTKSDLAPRKAIQLIRSIR